MISNSQITIFDGINTIYISYTISGIIGDDIVDISNNYIILYDINSIEYTIPVDIYNIILYGASANNYFIANILELFGSVVFPLVVNFYTTEKYYDGTNIAYVSYYTLSGIIFEQNIDISTNYIALYESINVGTNIKINISNIQIYGNSLIHYYLNDVKYITGSIIPAPIIPNFYAFKIYDMINTAYLTYTLSGIIGNEIIDLSPNYIALYESSDVGTEILVDISNIELIGVIKQQRLSAISIYKALGGGWK